jgi:hypothetical protein
MALKKPARAKRKLGTSKTVDRECPPNILSALAERARYVGSAYHRPPGSKMGKPAGRAHPTAGKCDAKWTFEDANRVLKDAIRNSFVSPDAREGFPQFAWHLDGGTLYEAVLSNQTLGEYHAYPLNDRREWPRGFQ